MVTLDICYNKNLLPFYFLYHGNGVLQSIPLLSFRVKREIISV